ncbi:diguanylate cyclase [Candidatus Omnitrophota bacterium]
MMEKKVRKSKNGLEKLPKNIYKQIIEEIYDCVYFVNKKRKIIFWNKQSEKLTGYKKKEILGKYCYDNLLKHIDNRGKKLCLMGGCPLMVAIKTNKPQSHRVYLRRKDGVRIPVDVHTKSIKYRGKTIGAVEVFRDASMYERVERQKERAKNASLLDVLTSLPNRRYINKRLETELNRFIENREELYVSIVDVDHFKRINDTFGHKKGDLVLIKISRILENNLRATDFVGRYGGEEFLIILPNTPRKNCRIALERIRTSVEDSLPLDKKEKVTISIGTAKAKIKDKPDGIFKRADKALYKAKNSGRNTVKFA